MKNYIAPFTLVAFGLAICVGGIYVGETDDAPGAAVVGILAMICTIVIAVKIGRRK